MNVTDDGTVPGPDLSPRDSRGEDPIESREEDSSDQPPVAAKREDHDHDRGPVRCGNYHGEVETRWMDGSVDEWLAGHHTSQR